MSEPMTLLELEAQVAAYEQEHRLSTGQFLERFNDPSDDLYYDIPEADHWHVLVTILERERKANLMPQKRR